MGVTVYFSFDQPQGVRGQPGNAGQFNSAYGKLKPLYRMLAEELKEETANIILAERSARDKNPNKENEKGTLARVTASPGNSVHGNNGFSVGIKTYLDRSKAKYARIIEEGSATAAPAYSSSMISGGWKPPGAEYYGTAYFIPARADRRLTDLPRRDIEPLFAYSRAWDNINARGRLKAIWRQLLVDAGLVSKYGPLPKKYQFPTTTKVQY